MKFGYALLYVADVGKTVVFYESAFGLKRKLVVESGYAEMDTGDTTLGFVSHVAAAESEVEYRKPDSEGPPPAFEIALVSDDVLTAYERAVSAGAKPIAPPKEKPWGQTVAYVRDLDGFLVELCSPVAQPW